MLDDDTAQKPSGFLPAPSSRYADLSEQLALARGSRGWLELDPLRAEALDTTASVVIHAAPEGYLALHRLIARYGHERVSHLQTGLDELLGPGAQSEVDTGLIWRVGDERHTRARLAAAGADDDLAADAAASTYGHMFWILLRDIERVRPSGLPASPAAFHALLKRGTVEEWRATLAPVARNPWSPYAEDLAQLAEGAGLPIVAQSLRACRDVYQLRLEGQERMAVAHEIRNRVALSGRTQREFAAYIGTSPSRLSTYVNGKVTPSSAMLLRIQRASRLLAERRADPA